MGDRNQLLFVQSHAQLVKGPILEVGSKDYGTTQDFRSLFPGEEYIGTDMFPGKGVDIVLDLTEDFERIDRALQGKRFNTIICMSVLEHCSDPFRMARNIESLLTEEGVLLLGVPFVWEIHGYPDDYWRFTPNGVKRLFPGLDFETHAGSAWTSRDGESGKLDAISCSVSASVHARKGTGWALSPVPSPPCAEKSDCSGQCSVIATSSRPSC